MYSKQFKISRLATANIYFSLTCLSAPGDKCGCCNSTQLCLSFDLMTSDKGGTPPQEISFSWQRLRTRGNHIWSFCSYTAYITWTHIPLVKKSHMNWSNVNVSGKYTLPIIREANKYLKTIIIIRWLSSVDIHFSSICTQNYLPTSKKYTQKASFYHDIRCKVESLIIVAKQNNTQHLSKMVGRGQNNCNKHPHSSRGRMTTTWQLLVHSNFEIMLDEHYGASYPMVGNVPWMGTTRALCR